MVEKIANKTLLKQIIDSEAASATKYEIERTLLANDDWLLLTDESPQIELQRSNFEFSVEWSKLIFSWWTESSSQSWRVTAYEIKEAEIIFRASRGTGKDIFYFALRDTANWRSSVNKKELATNELRTNYSELLSAVLKENFHDLRVQRISLRGKFSLAQPAQYVRFMVQFQQQNILVVGINERETQPEIDGIITNGLIWAAELKTPVHRLWLCIPHGKATTVLERLTLLNFSAINLLVECFEVDESERSLQSVKPFSQAELLNVHPRGLIWADEEVTLVSAWRERIVSLAPEAIDVCEDAHRKFESYSIRGLEFARTYDVERRQIKFGVAHYPDEIAAKYFRAEPRKTLTEGNFSALANLVNEIVTHRNPNPTELRHPFYRLRSEAWLESLLRRDIRILDATLDPEFVYAQIPTWLGDERSVLDLLTINHHGRLVIIEIKAVEDMQLPLQGLDYWLRVEQARLRGEFERRNLFAGAKILDQSPLLYLVAPRLRFHRSFKILSDCLASEIEAFQIGLNSSWRSGVKVNSFEKLGK